MSERGRRLVMLSLAVALLAHAGSPTAVLAQRADAPPQVVRGRFGPDGGTLAVGNVRLLIPAGAFGYDQFVALGVGGIPPPAQPIAPTGDTGVLVSSSALPADALSVLIAPSAADLRAVNSDPARLALMNVATQEIAACRPQASAVACTVTGPGLYLVVGGASTAGPVPTLTSPAGGQRRRTSAALLAGGGAALLSGVLLLYLLRPLRNSSESNQP